MFPTRGRQPPVWEAIAERLRQAIAAEAFTSPEGESIAVTASFGVASYPAADIKDGTELFAVADRRLYEAKRRGRDRVIGGDDTLAAPESDGDSCGCPVVSS